MKSGVMFKTQRAPSTKPVEAEKHVSLSAPPEPINKSSVKATKQPIDRAKKDFERFEKSL